MTRRPPRSTLFHSTTLFRSAQIAQAAFQDGSEGPPAVGVHVHGVGKVVGQAISGEPVAHGNEGQAMRRGHRAQQGINLDRKSTRLNSSHANISYAVFCLKKT